MFDDGFLLYQAVFITSSGAWKLGGFGFAIPADQNSGDSSSIQSFHYAVSSSCHFCVICFRSFSECDYANLPWFY